MYFNEKINALKIGYSHHNFMITGYSMELLTIDQYLSGNVNYGDALMRAANEKKFSLYQESEKIFNASFFIDIQSIGNCPPNNANLITQCWSSLITISEQQSGINKDEIREQLRKLRDCIILEINNLTYIQEQIRNALKKYKD